MLVDKLLISSDSTEAIWLPTLYAAIIKFVEDSINNRIVGGINKELNKSLCGKLGEPGSAYFPFLKYSVRAKQLVLQKKIHDKRFSDPEQR